MDSTAIKTIPEIITAASKTGLGIVALLILVLALFGFYFFRSAAVHYRFAVFLLMFAGAAVFGYAALAVQREDAIRTQAQLLPDLKLNLAFIGTDEANPHRAQVRAYVQPSTDLEGTIDSTKHLRKDVQSVPGPGGIYLVFHKLTVGDTVYVEVQDRDKKWQSYAMKMLEANLQMKPMEE